MFVKHLGFIIDNVQMPILVAISDLHVGPSNGN